jgi:hypothetical protein
MLFFQVLLLGGYLYAHLLQKLPAGVDGDPPHPPRP